MLMAVAKAAATAHIFSRDVIIAIITVHADTNQLMMMAMTTLLLLLELVIVAKVLGRIGARNQKLVAF